MKQPKYRVIALPMSDAATFFRAEVSLLDLYFCLLNFKLFKTFQKSLLEIGVVVLMYRGNSISERYSYFLRIFSVTIEYCGGGGNIVGPQRLHSWSKVFRFWQATPARLACKFKGDACGGGYVRTKCKRAKDTKIALRKTFLYQIGVNCIRFRINEFNHRKAKHSCPSRTVHHM